MNPLEVTFIYLKIDGLVEAIEAQGHSECVAHMHTYVRELSSSFETEFKRFFNQFNQLPPLSLSVSIPNSTLVSPKFIIRNYSYDGGSLAVFIEHPYVINELAEDLIQRVKEGRYQKHVTNL